MAYHIRRADNGDERSLHADTLEGLEAAICEAAFRAEHTQVSYEIYDDVLYAVVSVVSPDDVAQAVVEHEAKKAQVKYGNDWFLMGIIGVLLVAIACRMFVFR